jgi:hypothetical protein
MNLVAEIPSLSSCTNQEKKKLMILYGFNRQDKCGCFCDVVPARITVYLYLYVSIYSYLYTE